MRAVPYTQALITGGSGGIGRAIAQYLVERGVSVLLVARNPENLAKVKAALEKKSAAGVIVKTWSCDISDQEAVKRMTAEVVRTGNVPDFLVNCAGMAYPHYFEQLSTEQFEKTLSINVTGTWNVLKEIVPLMQQGSHVVNVSSMAGFVGTFGYTAYSASKFAIIGLSEALRNELSVRGIGVSVLCPPDTDTAQLEQENLTKPYETKVIAGNAGILQPEEVARSLFSGLRRGRFLIIPGMQGKLIYYAKRILPDLVFKIMDGDAKKAHRRRNGE